MKSEEYKKAKIITEQRLYLETMENILPGLKKFVVTSDKGSNLLNFLNLNKD